MSCLREHARLCLPSGLTSGLPLLPLVQQQAQLIAHISGKHGALPRVQHHSFEISGPDQQVLDLAWSPSNSLEDASRDIVLDFGWERPPVVVNVETGQQSCPIQGGAAPVSYWTSWTRFL